MKYVHLSFLILFYLNQSINAQVKKSNFECCCGKKLNYNKTFYHFVQKSGSNEIYIQGTLLDNPKLQYGYYMIDGKSYRSGNTCSYHLESKMFCSQTCAMYCYNTYYKNKYALIDEPPGLEVLVGLFSFFADGESETNKNTKKSTQKKTVNINTPASSSKVTEPVVQAPKYIRTYATQDDILKKGILIKKGMEGSIVSELQQKLLDKGIKKVSELGTATGIFDVVMEKAVMEFQKMYSLSETGVIDRRTLEVLNLQDFIEDPYAPKGQRIVSPDIGF